MPSVRRIKSVKWDEDDLDDYYSDDYSDSEEITLSSLKVSTKTPAKLTPKPNAASKKEASPKNAAPTLRCPSPSDIICCSPKAGVKNAKPAPDSPPSRYPLNVVVLGAVDAGKSTLLGHLLTLTNCVDKRLKNLKHLSWILDQGDDERDRGITIDPTKCQFNLSLKNMGASNAPGLNTDVPVGYETIKVNVIDTPGHHDLIQNLVIGAVFANSAVIIVDSNDVLKSNVFRGYFSEHILMLYFLGIKHVAVCVNKIDRFDYAQEIYERVAGVIKALVRPYETIKFLFLPVSGLNGDNLTARSEKLSWYRGPSLIEALQVGADTRAALRTRHHQEARCHIRQGHMPHLRPLGLKQEQRQLLVLRRGQQNARARRHVHAAQLSPGQVHRGRLPGADAGAGAGRRRGARHAQRRRPLRQHQLRQRLRRLPRNEGRRDRKPHRVEDHGIKNNTSSIVRTSHFAGFIYLNGTSTLRLTIGQNVELFVGYAKQSAHIRALELIENAELVPKKTYSIAPGQFAFAEFAPYSPILVEPIARTSNAIINTIRMFQGGTANGRAEREAEHLGILSRLLVRVAGNFVAGGVVVAR